MRRRLNELQRGRRLAATTEAMHRLTGRAGEPGAMREAEALLLHLQERHTQAIETDAALDRIDRDTSTVELLRSEGFGPRPQAGAIDVLNRLKLKAAALQPLPDRLSLTNTNEASR